MNSNFVYMSNRVDKIAIFGSLRCNPHHGEYVTELRYWPPPLGVVPSSDDQFQLYWNPREIQFLALKSSFPFLLLYQCTFSYCHVFWFELLYKIMSWCQNSEISFLEGQLVAFRYITQKKVQRVYGLVLNWMLHRLGWTWSWSINRLSWRSKEGAGRVVFRGQNLERVITRCSYYDNEPLQEGILIPSELIDENQEALGAWWRWLKRWKSLARVVNGSFVKKKFWRKCRLNRIGIVGLLDWHWIKIRMIRLTRP